MFDPDLVERDPLLGQGVVVHLLRDSKCDDPRRGDLVLGDDSYLDP